MGTFRAVRWWLEFLLVAGVLFGLWLLGVWGLYRLMSNPETRSVLAVGAGIWAVWWIVRYNERRAQAAEEYAAHLRAKYPANKSPDAEGAGAG